MEVNRIEAFFRQTITELNYINGRIIILNNYVGQTKKRVELESSIGHHLHMSVLPFRDMTLDKPGKNMFTLNTRYELNRPNLNDEIDMILSRECLFQVSQAYEIVETFLYELIIVKGLMHLVSKSKTNTFDSIRLALRKLNDRKNNKHLLAIIRANTNQFEKFEKDNYWDLDFEQWYDMLSEVRHCITHSRMVMTLDLRAALVSRRYENYFLMRQYERSQVLFMNESMCKRVLSRIADYVFLIFKMVDESCYSKKDNTWANSLPFLKAYTS